MTDEAREAMNAYHRERYRQNPEPQKEANRRYVAAHREEVNAKKRERYHKDPSKAKAAKERYWQRKADQAKARKAQEGGTDAGAENQ